MKIMRVFPRRTNATPTDDLVHIGSPDLFTEEKAPDRVHISVTFSWDLPAAEKLQKEWSAIAPTEIGGPATGQRGEDFTPGMYLREGYVITSRGCPNCRKPFMARINQEYCPDCRRARSSNEEEATP